MGKRHDCIASDLQTFIDEQPIFFVATAPLGGGWHVNLSPKGLDTFRVIGPREVMYLDLTGSGNETAVHVTGSGRLTLMFCAFQGRLRIVRLYCRGDVITRRSPRLRRGGLIGGWHIIGCRLGLRSYLVAFITFSNSNLCNAMLPHFIARFLLITIFALAASALHSQSLVWHIVGPPGGNFATVIRDSSGTLLAAWGNRVFRSTDDGRSWTASRAGTSFRYINDLACDAGRTVIAAAEFGGIMKSTDGGVTWRESKQGLGKGYYHTVIISRNGTYLAGAAGHGLYRSDDSGATWSQIKLTGPNGQDYSNVGFNQIREGAPGEFYVAMRRGLIRSLDGGITWTFLDTSIFKPVVGSVEVAPWGDVYSMYRDTLYRSSDKGNTWEKLLVFKASLPRIFTHGPMIYVNGDSGPLQSSDSGRTWSPVPYNGTGLLWALRGVLAPSHLYALDDRGLVHSSDRGGSWEPLYDGYSSMNIRRMASDSNSTIYINSPGRGLYRTSDLGATWKRLEPVDTFRTITALSASRDRHLFVGTNRALFVSNDAGDSFQRINMFDTDVEVQSVLTRPDGFVHVELDGITFLESRDFGVTWEVLRRNINAGSWSIITSPKSGVMFASSSRGFNRSTDDGRTWEDIRVDSLVTALAGAPDGTVFAATNRTIIKSTDNGTTWTDCYSFPPATLSLIRTKSGRLIASGDSIIVYSDDAGVTWHSLFEPEADIVVQNLLEGSDGYLYGATETWGVLRSDRPSAAPMAPHLSHERAIGLSWRDNPVSERAILTYDLPETGVVHLRLHDLDGAPVRSYPIGRREAGRYSAELDVAGLPSGLYYCTVTCGARTAVAKLLIVR